MTATDSPWVATLLTVAIGGAGAALFHLIGLPAALLTGSASFVTLATLLGLRVVIPAPLRDAVFVVLGVQIGSTVTPEVLDAALTWPVSLAMLALTLVLIMCLVPSMLIRFFAMDRLTALLAAAPGHLSYVLGLSTDLSADVSRVALVQSVRVLLLTLLLPALISLWGVEGTSFLQVQHTGSTLALIVIIVIALAVGLILRHWNAPAALLLGAMGVSAIAHGGALTTGTVPGWLTTAAFICMGSLIGTRFSGVTLAQLRGALSAGVATTLISCAITALARRSARR